MKNALVPIFACIALIAIIISVMALPTHTPPPPQSSPTQKNIVAFGDSTMSYGTSSFGSYAHPCIPDPGTWVDLIGALNFACAGMDTTAIAERMSISATAIHPESIVLFTAGSNDVAYGKTAQEITAGWETMFDVLRSRNISPRNVWCVEYIEDNHDAWDPLGDIIFQHVVANAIMRHTCTTFGGNVISLSHLAKDGKNISPHTPHHGGAHPWHTTSVGHHRIADAVAQKIPL